MRGILKKMLKYWTIRLWDDRPSDPAYYIEDCRIFSKKVKAAI